MPACGSTTAAGNDQARRNRAGLDQALTAVWDGPVFTVTKFDRFARNTAAADQVLTDLSGRGVLFGLGGWLSGRRQLPRPRAASPVMTALTWRCRRPGCAGRQGTGAGCQAGFTRRVCRWVKPARSIAASVARWQPNLRVVGGPCRG